VIDLMPDRMAEVFMELLIPDSCEILASYDHPAWLDYAAITRNRYGKGAAYYLGCMTDSDILERILSLALESCGIPIPEFSFPVILRKGTTARDKQVRFFLNFSPDPQSISYTYPQGTDLLTGLSLSEGDSLTLNPWDLYIIEEN